MAAHLSLGLYKGDDYKMYEGCQKVKWNPFGEGLMFMDHGIPIIAIKTLANFTTIVEKVSNQFS